MSGWELKEGGARDCRQVNANCAKEAFNKLPIKKYKIRRRNPKQPQEPAAYS